VLSENETAVLSDSAAASSSKKERERRRNLGIYYTPPEAAKILARWAIQNSQDTVLEPSFGGCAMLAAAVSAFKSLGNHDPSLQLFGYDIDSAAFQHLTQLGIDNCNGQFRKADFLRTSANELKVDAVLANPPFVSHHRQSAVQRQLTVKLRAKYFPGLPKFASLWAFFVLHSMSFLRDGGRMAFVLPNAVATAGYGRALLEFLSHRFQKVEVVHVAERLFIQAGADERIVLLLLSNFSSAGLEHPSVIVTKDVARISEIDTSNVACDAGAEPDSTDIRGAATALLAEQFGSALVTLENVATVRIGEVVGDIQFFVRPLPGWKAIGIGANHVVPLLTRAVQVAGLFVTSESLKSTTTRIPYLLLPAAGNKPKGVENYLGKYAQEEIDDNETFKKRSVWYRCSYDTAAHAFIGSMNHEWPRIIENSAKVSCANSYYKITLTEQKGLAEWLSLFSLTTPFRLSAEVLGRVRGGGGIKLEPSDVRKLCLPKVLPPLNCGELNSLRDRLNELVCRGELDAAGQLADSEIFLKTNLIDTQTMFDMRRYRLALTTRRLQRL
jgi:adenine-specific DNA-methyltransferase